MLGGFLGTFAVGPLVHGPIGWQSFWIYAGLATAGLAVLAFVMTPGRPVVICGQASDQASLADMAAPFKTVLSNPKSWLCGMIDSHLFLPTTIGDMIWGVPFLQQGLHELSPSAQAEVLNISRGSISYLAAPVLAQDVALIRRIYELYLAVPFAASRMLRDLLAAEGRLLGRRRTTAESAAKRTVNATQAGQQYDGAGQLVMSAR